MPFFKNLSAYDDRSARLAGIGLMVLSIFMFSFGDAMGKFLVGTYSVGQLLFLRACAALLLLSPLIWTQRHQFLHLERPGLQLFRVVLSTLEVAAFFLATVYLPLADVITYYLAGPIFVTAMSAIFLGEKVGWRRWVGVLAGMAGALIIVGPVGGTFQWALALPLAAAFSNALYQIATRKLRGADSPTTTIFYTGMAGTVVCTLALPFNWVTPDLTAAALMVLLGTLGGISHFCLIRAYSAAPAATVAPFGYTTLVWAAVYSLMVFGEDLRLSTIAGTIIIVGSGVYIFYREQTRSRQAS